MEWRSLAKPSNGIVPQCFAMICKGGAWLGLAKRRNGIAQERNDERRNSMDMISDAMEMRRAVRERSAMAWRSNAVNSKLPNGGIKMKTITINEVGWDLHLLYREAIQTKARRGLFGYMLRTGRADNLIFGGAFQLLKQLEPVWGKEAYNLRSETAAARDIIAVAEVALAGGFDRFALSRREMQRTIKALDDIEI